VTVALSVFTLLSESEVKMGAGDSFGYYAYISDNGNTYNVRLSTADAAAGGFGAEVAALSNPGWPWHKRDLRHVTGADSANAYLHGRLKVATAANALFKSGGTWTNSVTEKTYNVQGAEGERRPANHI
jgi:hypothetical protein